MFNLRKRPAEFDTEKYVNSLLKMRGQLLHPLHCESASKRMSSSKDKLQKVVWHRSAPTEIVTGRGSVISGRRDPADVSNMKEFRNGFILVGQGTETIASAFFVDTKNKKIWIYVFRSVLMNFRRRWQDSRVSNDLTKTCLLVTFRGSKSVLDSDVHSLHQCGPGKPLILYEDGRIARCSSPAETLCEARDKTVVWADTVRKDKATILCVIAQGDETTEVRVYKIEKTSQNIQPQVFPVSGGCP